MGRRRKLNKLPMTSIAVPEKFVEDQRAHKPRAWSWADYVTRKFSKMSYDEEQNKELTAKIDDIEEQLNQASRTNGIYAKFLEDLRNLKTVEEIHHKLDGIFSSNGVINIATLLHQ